MDAEYILLRGSNFKLFGKIPTGKYTHIGCLTISIPKTFYNLPQQASIWLTENGNQTQLVFEAGTYQVNSLRVILEQKMNTGLYTYSVSFPNSYTEVQTGKYTILVGANQDQPTMRIDDSFLAQMLGFDSGVDYVFSSNSLKSVRVCNFQVHDELLVKSNIVGNQISLLQSVYAAGNEYNDSILFQNPDIYGNSKEIVPLPVGDIYDFYLLDNEGNGVELNGNDWSMVLILYNLEEKIDQHLKNILAKIDRLNTNIENYIEYRKKIDSV